MDPQDLFTPYLIGTAERGHGILVARPTTWPE
jgi:hypothetical protein